MSDERESLSVAELHALITIFPLEEGKSANIYGIGYLPEQKTMAVQFLRKTMPAAIYHYQNVTQEEFDAFAQAESLSTHFNQTFKADPGRWPYVRLPDLPPAEGQRAQ